MSDTNYGQQTDPFFGKRQYTGPAWTGKAVTPGDSYLPFLTRFLWIGGAGDVEVLLRDDDNVNGAPVVLKSVPAGTLLPLAARKVLATSTTATNIVALL